MAVAFALAIVFSGFAQDNQRDKYALSELSLSAFKKLVVNADIDVVLVQNDTLKKAYIEGDDQLVPQIAVTVKNGTLTIASNNNKSYKGKVQVTVTVNKLAELEINAMAAVSSVNAIKAPSLSISVNNDCDVHLKSTGKIVFNTAEGYYVNYIYPSTASNTIEQRKG